MVFDLYPPFRDRDDGLQVDVYPCPPHEKRIPDEKLPILLRDALNLPTQLVELIEAAPAYSAGTGISAEQHDQLIEYASQLAFHANLFPQKERGSMVEYLVSEEAKGISAFGSRSNQSGAISPSVAIEHLATVNQTSLVGTISLTAQAVPEFQTRRASFRIDAEVSPDGVTVAHYPHDQHAEKLKRLVLQRGPQSWSLGVDPDSALGHWLTELAGTTNLTWLNRQHSFGIIVQAVQDACAKSGVSHLLLPVTPSAPEATEASRLSGRSIAVSGRLFYWEGYGLRGEELVSVAVTGKLKTSLQRLHDQASLQEAAEEAFEKLRAGAVADAALSLEQTLRTVLDDSTGCETELKARLLAASGYVQHLAKGESARDESVRLFGKARELLDAGGHDYPPSLERMECACRLAWADHAWLRGSEYRLVRKLADLPVASEVTGEMHMALACVRLGKARSALIPGERQAETQKAISHCLAAEQLLDSNLPLQLESRLLRAAAFLERELPRGSRSNRFQKMLASRKLLRELGLNLSRTDLALLAADTALLKCERAAAYLDLGSPADQQRLRPGRLQNLLQAVAATREALRSTTGYALGQERLAAVEARAD